MWCPTECDLETSTMGWPRATIVFNPWGKVKGEIKQRITHIWHGRYPELNCAAPLALQGWELSRLSRLLVIISIVKLY
jgi:hypothetical protein